MYDKCDTTYLVFFILRKTIKIIPINTNLRGKRLRFSICCNLARKKNANIGSNSFRDLCKSNSESLNQLI